MIPPEPHSTQDTRQGRHWDWGVCQKGHKQAFFLWFHCVPIQNSKFSFVEVKVSSIATLP